MDRGEIENQMILFYETVIGISFRPLYLIPTNSGYAELGK